MRWILQKTCEISGLLTDSGENITLLSVRSTQLYTLSIGWQKCFEFEKYRLQTAHSNSIVLNFTAALSIYTSYYVNTPAFLTQFITNSRTQSNKINTVCTKKSLSPLYLWTTCNSEITLCNLRLVWCWLTFLTTSEESLFVQFA